MTALHRTAKAVLGATLLVLLAAGTSAMAHDKDTKWEKRHPRRDQVNDRLANQHRRIHHEVKEGDLTKQQAQALRQSDHQIRQEERDMAAQNGGHITKTEQKSLNQQENAVSKQIGK
jgi:hypothetical protein